MKPPLPDPVLDLAFRKARTFNTYLDIEVTSDTLRELYDLLKWGPTSSNSQPLRLVWCVSTDARERLANLCIGANAEKIRRAPVTAIFGMDLDFVDHLPRMFLHGDARTWYGEDPKIRWDSALRNSSLQAGYFIIAARLLGLDTNPMAGFDEDALNEVFFPNSRTKVNFISTLGYGDSSTLYPRAPRFDFDEINQVI